MQVFTYTISIILMILIPVLLAAGLRRTASTPWLLFALGSLTFILSQVIHLPLNNWLADIGLLPEQGMSGSPLWRTALILGLTAGLSEELLRAAGYFFLAKVRAQWLGVQDGVMLGLGHGGIEAMVFGGVLTAATLSALLPLRGANLEAMNLLPEQLEILRNQLASLEGSPLVGFLPLLERLIAISAHVGFSLLVWKAFAAGRLARDWYYIPLAVAYHAAVDFIAVYIGQMYTENSLVVLLIIAASMLPLWAWGLWQARRNWQPLPPEARLKIGALDASLQSEIRVFFHATSKELRQLWRTRRLLVIGAVFLLFGMGSPMLAKFTPEILKSIEGAELFADLIPDPTAGDAMAQYVENLTQFGFILAILLAMGVVVSEKERGVAPMILSKPMPRWAFIASKFASQFIMYLGGFILAGLGAYYYTLFLFGSLDLSGFVLANGLMLLWLLTFVALGLLGSTLGASTAAAGGIGLGLSVALMLLGSLPNYGQLLPGALIGWATLASQKAAGITSSMPGFNIDSLAASGGAAACALIVIVLSLVFAIGIFEQQEL
jgi:ABC-2 type transport system permease protein